MGEGVNDFVWHGSWKSLFYRGTKNEEQKVVFFPFFPFFFLFFFPLPFGLGAYIVSRIL